jgi:hypothetical protein
LQAIRHVDTEQDLLEYREVRRSEDLHRASSWEALSAIKFLQKFTFQRIAKHTNAIVHVGPTCRFCGRLDQVVAMTHPFREEIAR